MTSDERNCDAGIPQACNQRGYMYAHAIGGPQDGQWYWTVLFMADGSVGNGGTGFTATGREAREACEARIPETMRD